MVFLSDECVICLSSSATEVFLPCAHACTCQACSDQIKQAKMACPLCRAAITAFSSAKNEVAVPIVQSELDDFANNKREAYVKQLRHAMTSNAGFLGKSKLAKSVGRAACSELEERVLQNQGTDRFGGMKAQYTVADDKQTFTVTYKVQGKRKPVVETYAFMEWDAAEEALLDVLDGERIPTMDICIYYPEYFWLAKYHKKMDALENLGGMKRRALATSVEVVRDL